MMAELKPRKKWISFSKLSRKTDHVRGPLDPVERLEQTYVQMIEKNELVREAMANVFQTARIAVLGRSGSGKTTTIRLLMGDTGPRSISEGTAGTQDIDHEWHNPDPDLPIIIHDSNGMDTRGPERLDTIKKFLDKHQTSSKFSDRIHLIWYVISAGDVRFLDDGDLMKMISEYDIPLLLVMTFSDWKDAVAENVTERNLDKVLCGVKQKESVKERMIKIGNKVRVGDDNKLGGQIDLKGLKLLSNRTAEYIDKRLRYTWAASQAVDMNGKLGECAKLIVEYKCAAVCTSIIASPVAHEMKLLFMFTRILECLCRIWGVPPNFKKALFKNILMKEGIDNVLQSLMIGMVAAAGIVVTVGATIFTGGVASPTLVVACLTAISVVHKKTPVLLTSYSLLILGSILYLKHFRMVRNVSDADLSVDDYTRLCEEFARSPYEHKLKQIAQQSHSTWNTMMRSKTERGKIKAQIIEFFYDLVRNRPDSLNTLLQIADASDHNTNADGDLRGQEPCTPEQHTGDDRGDDDTPENIEYNFYL